MSCRSGFEDLAAELDRLRHRSVESRSDLSTWYVAARQLEDRLVEKGGLASELPSIVWHYLADADVRRKHEEYDKLQDRQIRLVIQYLKRGEMPSDDEIMRYASTG